MLRHYHSLRFYSLIVLRSEYIHIHNSLALNGDVAGSQLKAHTNSGHPTSLEFNIQPVAPPVSSKAQNKQISWVELVAHHMDHIEFLEGTAKHSQAMPQTSLERDILGHRVAFHSSPLAMIRPCCIRSHLFCLLVLLYRYEHRSYSCIQQDWVFARI